MHTNRWLAETDGKRGPEYARVFRELEESGADVHGEARAIDRLLREATGGDAGRVLDAGCGTGRVAVELARLGHQVTGVDMDASMLAEAQAAAAAQDVVVDLLAGDLVELADLLAARPAYDVVAAPGNVMIYLTPGTEPDVVANLAGVLAPGGLLIAGFAADRHVSVDQYDEWCRAAGLSSVRQWSTWDGAPLAPGGGYVVSVHRR